MKKFLDKDFLLQTETAQALFHKYAENEPIFDFHNHLSAQEIYENKSLGNLANAWLDHDHYKWRAMRAAGVPEEFVTGHINIDGSVKSDDEIGLKGVFRESYDFTRYHEFVKTLRGCIGNPLYHWSYLELQRYFGIEDVITEKNEKEVWEKCNKLLAQKDFYPRQLLMKMNVKALCTTDDPCDNLQWHKKLADEWKDCKVLPSFRPDNAINCTSKGFGDYITKLAEVSNITIKTIDDLVKALSIRMDYFKQVGSLVSDHSLEENFYEETNFDHANYAFLKAWVGKNLTEKEICQYKTYLLSALGKLYAEKGFVMQIHIGALRDNNSTLLAQAGKNIGTDSLQDFNYAPQIGALLNSIYSKCDNGENPHCVPRVVLYNLNPKDNDALATMAVNFRNCIFGPAWWFNDHKNGIEKQIQVYARTAVLSGYVGMLTDSRSFLSYPRHEYFRRILCNYIGNLVENGEYAWDEEFLGEMVKNISYSNSVGFFDI